MARKRHLHSVDGEGKPDFPDVDPSREAFISGDEEGKDYSTLKAEADKIRADGAMAVKKLNAWNESDAMLERANEITAWKRPSSTP